MSTRQLDSATWSEDLYQNILRAFRQWNDVSASSPLKELSLFRRAQQASGATEHQVTNKILLDELNTLEGTKPEYARILRLRFLDGMTGFEVANRLNLSQATVERKQSEAIHALAAILAEQEDAALQAHRARFVARLEAPFYDRLFGVENHLDALSDLLTTNESMWLLLIEGMGGIGKTSLADALMRRAIDRNLFEDFGWISARQQRFQLSGNIRAVNASALTAESLVETLATQLLVDTPLSVPFSAKQAFPLLQTRLKQIPHLIVVDNLETVADVEGLLPTLQRLADPSKFVLTSRKSIQDEVTVYPFKVPALRETDALNLVRHEAGLRNQPELATGSDEQLRPIFDTVGGNPLALRLVVGQSHIHALPDILENLQEARGQAVENLYSYIYRYAWDHLDDLTRRVLVAMPFVPENGGDLAYLAKVSGLAMPDLSNGLAQLVMLNLIDRNGDLAESRYTIHSLTRTFLHKQVVAWQ